VACLKLFKVDKSKYNYIKAIAIVITAVLYIAPSR